MGSTGRTAARLAVIGLSALLTVGWPAASYAACDGDCDGNGVVFVDEVVTLVGIALGLLPAAVCTTRDPGLAVTIDELVRAVLHGLGACPQASSTPDAAPTPASEVTPSPTTTPSMTPEATRTASATASPTPTPTDSPSRTPAASATSTPSRTPTLTASPTPTTSATPTFSSTPTPGLGPRRFSLDPAASGLLLLPAETMVSGFSGHLDLAAGVPDPTTGLTPVDVLGASAFLSLDLEGSTRLCIKPIVPVMAAGVLSCNGGLDLGVGTVQDHRIGMVGAGGFTAETCLAAGGTVETAADPHPGVCNGPVVVGGGEPDSGAGALLLAPDARYGTRGLPAEVSIAPGSCETHGAGTPTVLGFVSGLSRAEILDAGGVPGQSLVHEERGAAFSCQSWQEENGPGRLVLSVPSLHAALGDDLITVFILDD